MFRIVFSKVFNACKLTHFDQEEWNKNREIFCSLHPSFSDYNNFLKRIFNYFLSLIIIIFFKMFYPVFLKVLNACGLTHFAQEEWNKNREIFCSLHPSSSDYNRFFCNVFLTRPTISFKMFHSVFLNVLKTCELTHFAQEEWKKKSGDILLARSKFLWLQPSFLQCIFN